MKTLATGYMRVDKAGRGMILDELCGITGWHRNHARKVLKAALRPNPVSPRSPRPTKYGPQVVAALVVCWSVLGRPTGKRLAPILPELVGILRRFGELDIDDDTAALLVSMSAATIDRRLASERRKRELAGRGCTNPRMPHKYSIPLRTCAGWDDAKPGLVVICLASHDGDNDGSGDHVWTLTVTDVATGWTENRSVRNTDRRWILAALDGIAAAMPFPILGVDSDNRSELISEHLRAWCEERQVTFIRSRPGDKSDGIDPNNWGFVRTIVGYHRYDTAAELLLLNKIWELQSQLTNYFYPQQRLVSKVRTGGAVSKKYDIATTPHRRAEQHVTVSAERKVIVADSYAGINPAAVQRQIQALTSALLTLSTSKAGPKTKAVATPAPTRASSSEPAHHARQCQRLPPGNSSAMAEVESAAAEASILGVAVVNVGVGCGGPTNRDRGA